jgi:hypothetical protein
LARADRFLYEISKWVLWTHSLQIHPKIVVRLHFSWSCFVTFVHNHLFSHHFLH